MSRAEFLAELRGRLAGKMGEEELENALSYYEEYLDEAGPDREARALEELGSPAAVAGQLLEDAARPPAGRPGRRGPLVAVCAVLAALALGAAVLMAVSYSGPGAARPPAPSAPAATPTTTVRVPAPTPAATAEGGLPVTCAEGEFSRLDVEVGMGSVRVQSGEAFDLSLSSVGADKFGTPYELHSSIEGGVLSVWSTPESLSTDDSSNPSATVVLTLPAGAVLDRVKVYVGMGGLDWRGCAVSGRFTGQVGMGNIDVSGPITGDTGLESGMGDVALSVDGGPEGYSYDLETGMGGIRLDGKRQSGLDCEGGGGETELELSSGMGDVELSFGGK